MADDLLSRDAPVPERRRLEQSFWRARWLAVGAIALLTPLGGFHPVITAATVAALTIGNLTIYHVNHRASTLTAQRGLGVAAVSLDAMVVLGLAVAAPAGAVTITYGTLFVVVAEAAIRFAPVKALGAALLLLGGLAVAMAIRGAAADEPFDFRLLAVLGVLVLLAGTTIGSVVREIYRQGVAPPAKATSSAMAVANFPTEAPSVTKAFPEEAMALLTPRERQVLSLIAQGYSNAQIAAALVVEQKTVKNHINNIYGKLRLNSRYEAIAQMVGRRQ